MRRLLPLALACLLAAQAVSGTGRGLLQKSPQKAVSPDRKQYVQFAVSIQGKTCAELPQVPVGANLMDFNLAFRAAMRADVSNVITTFASNPAAIIATIGTPGTNCTDWSYNGVNYAGVRAAASFNGTNSTLIRDFLWDSTREGICSGKYRTDVWITVAGLMAANSLTVRLNNGSRQNPFGANMGWLPVPVLPCPAPKPSPSPPQVPSPSPEPAVPSPSPAPGCGAIPNSVQQADGSCKCTNPLFAIEGKDGDKLVSCVSSSATICPAPTSTAVRDNSTPVPKLLGCITPSTACPAPYTFPLYGQSPSTKMECRLPVVDCTYTPFTMKITDGNGVLIGCVDPSSNACPFVAYRSAGSSPAYKMEDCKKVDSCPIYSQTPTDSTKYTTSGRAADRTLTACLTLAADNKCPDSISYANFPVEVVKGDPTSCGGTTPNAPCVFGNASSPFTNTRVEECLATGAQCDPALYPLQMFNYVGAGAVVPTLVGCRQARPFPGTCDFSAANMGGNVSPPTNKDPNADSYTIEVYQTQANLVGCIVTKAPGVCPSSYPVANRDASGNLVSCAPSNNATNPCVANSGNPVPLKYANGTWMGICVARPQSCLVYAAAYGTPVSIRGATPGGDIVECRQQISVCPNTPVLDTDGTTAVLSTFPMFKTGADGKPVITSCYPPASVGNTCQLSADSANYFVPIRSSATNTTLLGCLQQGATSCPAEFPFTILNGAGQVVSCAPAGDQTSCASPLVPATTSGTLVGCVTLVGGACPAIYPTTIALGINQTAIECMTANSVCYKPTQPFSLFEQVTVGGSTYLELTWCINPQQSITDCNQANPAIATGLAGWINAAEVYNNAGTSIIGCVKTPTNPTLTCPVEFPFTFADSATFQCRAGIAPATSCAGAVAGATAPPTINTYTVDVKDVNGNLIGCTTPTGSACQPGNVIVSETANSASEICLAGNVTSCVGVTGPGGVARSFPIYSGANADGSAKLVRCIAPFAATDCTGTAVNGDKDFNVPVYPNTDGTGQVIACVRATAEVVTPCPSTAPFYLLGPNGSPLAACLQDRPACNITTTAWSGYTIPLTNAGNTDTLGCMLPTSTECPALPNDPYTVPFIIRDANGLVVRCELQSLNAVTSCTSFSPPSNLRPIIGSNVPGATGPVIGCEQFGTGGSTNGVYPNACFSGAGIYDANNNLVQCLSSASPVVCAEPYEVILTNGPAGDFQGCQNGNNIPAGVRVATLNQGDSNGCGINTQLALWGTRRDSPTECRNLPNNTPTSCTNSTDLILKGALLNYTSELYYRANTSTTLEGCQINTINTCPRPRTAITNEAYKYFIATVPGVLEACTELFSCSSNTIPVYSSPVATAPVGCVSPALNSSYNPCPTNWNGTNYSFFTADANGVVTACYPTGSACPAGTISLYVGTTGPVGCIPAGTSCPATQVAGQTYSFEFWAATSAADATPVLARCISAVNITNNCAGYTGYQVPLFSGNMITNVESKTGDAADGCVASGSATGAQCPSSHPYPVLELDQSGGVTIIACFSGVDAASCVVDYSAYNVPLCFNASVQAASNGGQCAPTNTRGCIRRVDPAADNDNGNPYYSGNTTAINRALAGCYQSVRKYPTTESYQRWVANVYGGAGSDLGDLQYMFGCFLSSGPNAVTVCDNCASAPDCYTYRVTDTFTQNLLGCTDGTQGACEQFAIQAALPAQSSWTCTKQT